MLCHRRPDRSFFWRGKQFPVCARCTGVHVGYLSLLVFPIAQTHLGWAWSLGLIAPTVLDGLLQARTRYESHNLTRVGTGVLAGVGTMSCLAIVGQDIGHFLLAIIQNGQT